ncbi:aminodeoxychorismate lyase [Nitrococcus mobilis]|uniref:Aminodeoxychorismate lyase n=1 Tax=Nitrococcus mobilis Nb-231 TaxID=314278 RepID=A4BUV5_9GAMM|nr:aminodeoxychorismate lyase [Nitrococcus mobilis]EAR20469.1 Aminotransferase, class IV [Nitrococcus mobilis Nb-231]
MSEAGYYGSGLLDPRDRGLQYGDGLFETMAVRDGRIPWLAYHLRRLEAGCARLQITPPEVAELRREIAALAAGQSRAIIKLIVTRGVGGRGYRPDPDVPSHRILMRHPWPAYAQRYAQEGIRLRVCRTRLASNPALAGLKHLNRLEQVLARLEWDDDSRYQEGLMLDYQGRVIEGTMTNLFIVRSGCLLTPDLSASGVAGVMREIILETAARKSLSCQMTTLSLPNLAQAEEIFVCNSVVGIWPVIALQRRRYPLGPVTRQLAAAIEACAAGTLKASHYT